MTHHATAADIHTPDELLQHQGRDYRRMEQVLTWLSAHYKQQPSLTEAAARLDLSEYHFQRLFRRWVGVSPKKYVQYLTLTRAKQCLDANCSVLDSAYEAGLSGPGRLHDLFVTLESVTPGEYKSHGAGLRLRYGVHDTPYSRWLVVGCERGVCGLRFVDDAGDEATLAQMQAGFEHAEWVSDHAYTATLNQRIFRPGAGAAPPSALVRGTAFEIKVWEALLNVPEGMLTSYADIARRIGQPTAARAVGNAVGKNPLAYLIPCHRVIQRSGVLGGYRWGTARKLAMLSRELAAVSP